MTTFEIMEKALARFLAINDAAIILKRYPELLAAEHRLAEFVSLIEIRQSDLDRNA